MRMRQRKTAVNKTFCIHVTLLLFMFESVFIFLQLFFLMLFSLFVCVFVSAILSVCSLAIERSVCQDRNVCQLALTLNCSYYFYNIVV